MLIEIWKDIIGYQGLYQISNIGRVKSLERYVDHKIYGKMVVYEKILSNTSEGIDSYIRVTLCKNGKNKRNRIHRLLAIHFIDNPNNYTDVDHIDGNKTNYNLNNLEWCSKKYNTQHAYDIGLNYSNPKLGVDNHFAKLNEKEVRDIMSLKGKMTQVDISHIYGINNGTVSLIHKQKIWKHLWK